LKSACASFIVDIKLYEVYWRFWKFHLSILKKLQRVSTEKSDFATEESLLQQLILRNVDQTFILVILYPNIFTHLLLLFFISLLL